MRICYVETDARAFTTHRRHLGLAALAAGHDVHLIAPGAEAGRDLLKAGFTYHPLPLVRGGMNPLGEAVAVAALVRLFRQLRPSVVHNFALKAVLYGALAARAAGVRAVVGSITGLGYAFMPGGLLRRALSRGVLTALRLALAGRNVRTIVQNPDDAAFFLAERVVEEDQLGIIYGSGVDTEVFVPSPEPEGTPIVLVGTRMLWDKGVGELVDAARLLRQRGVLCRIRLVGDPDAQNPASIPPEQLRAWATQGLVEWLPHSGDIVKHLRDATLACLPSYREGLPLFLAEAAAAGRACVTTDVPGCRSVVEEGVSGLIVPARDSERLAFALKQLLEDASLRRRMGEQGRRLALERFSKHVVTSQIFAVYDSLL